MYFFKELLNMICKINAVYSGKTLRQNAHSNWNNKHYFWMRLSTMDPTPNKYIITSKRILKIRLARATCAATRDVRTTHTRYGRRRRCARLYTRHSLSEFINRRTPLMFVPSLGNNAFKEIATANYSILFLLPVLDAGDWTK